MYESVDQDSARLGLIAASCSGNTVMTYLDVNIFHCHKRSLTFCSSLSVWSKWLVVGVDRGTKWSGDVDTNHKCIASSPKNTDEWDVLFLYRGKCSAQSKYLTHISSFNVCVQCLTFSTFEDAYHRRLGGRWGKWAIFNVVSDIYWMKCCCWILHRFVKYYIVSGKNYRTMTAVITLESDVWHPLWYMWRRSVRMLWGRSHEPACAVSKHKRSINH